MPLMAIINGEQLLVSCTRFGDEYSERAIIGIRY